MLSQPATSDQRGGVRLFFFAHQDDEFGVFHLIEESVAAGFDVLCIYCTTGVPEGKSPSLRERESLDVLQALGVNATQVLFAGATLGIADQQLIHKAATLVTWMMNFLQTQDVDSVYIPAWEGGHPDHDLLHAAVVTVMRQVNSTAPMWQFPLYNGWRRQWGFFRLFTPLPNNGPVTQERISLPRRRHYLKLCLAFRSQWTSWLGLWPALCWRYLLKGTQLLQLVRPESIFNRPHTGLLYYEQRGFARWHAVELVTQELINNRLALQPESRPDLGH